MTGESIPGVDPAWRPVDLPPEWLERKGPITWRHTRAGKKCEDCIQLLADWAYGKTYLTRAPGLARIGTWGRTQGGVTTAHCDAHHDLRIAKGDHQL